MKKIASTIAFLAMTSNIAMAGGDFTEPVEPEVNIPTQEVVIIEDDVNMMVFMLGVQ